MTLSVSSPQYFYQPGAMPRFTVHAVSRDGQPCRFNMGPKFVSVVIAAGNRRIWSSADCVSGTGPLVRPGEYQVSAVAGPLHSRSVNFVLGAKGVSGP